MVMNILRKRMKIVIWIAAVAFIALIFLAWGMDVTRRAPTGMLQRGVVGSVNGTNIGANVYRDALRTALSNLRAERGDEVDGLTSSLLEDRVFEQIVDEELIRQEISERGIGVTETEVVSFIKNVPPVELRSDTSLMTDGKFDVEKYRRIFQNPANLSWLVEYENYVRQALPRQKLMLTLYSTARLTDLEIADAFAQRRAKVKVNYILVTPERGGGAEPTEEDVRLYYEGDPETFRLPLTAQLSYVLFSTAPSASDSQAALEQVNGIYEELKAGADFAELAKQVSDDRQSSGEGGLVGWIKRGQVVPEFERAAFSMKQGDVSKPLLSQYGWHIVKVEARKADSVEVSHILVRVETSEETIDRAREGATFLLEDASKVGFDAAASNLGLAVQTLPPLSREQDLIPGIGYSAAIRDFAFTGKKGALSRVLPATQGFYVFRLDEMRDSHIPELDAVMDTVRALARKKKQMAGASAVADSAEALLSQGLSMSQVASRLGLEYVAAREFSVMSAYPDYPLELVGAASALTEGKVSKPVETDRGHYIVQIIQRMPPDSEQFKKMSSSLAGNLIDTKQKRVVDEWMGALRDKADVKDYRWEAYR